ncbi:MAG: YbaN family protein [Fusobacteriaceae bacterium]
MGILSVFSGVLGIFLPLIPTTPFILLAAFCFEKSSPKFHNLLLNSGYLGKYIRDYQEKKGITLINKVISISLLSFGIFKGYISVTSEPMKIIFIIIYFSVAFHILKLKTVN